MGLDPLEPGTLLCAGPAKRYRFKLVDTPPTRSGYALVYRAADRRLGGEVRIKELATEQTSIRRGGSTVMTQSGSAGKEAHRKLMNRFEDEIRRLNTVRHPNVVRVVDFWQERGTVYYALETLPHAISLYQWEPKAGEPRWTSIKALGVALLDALEPIHAAGLIQGDLSPETVVVGPDGNAVIFDVATARADWELAVSLGSLPWKNGFCPPELEFEQHIQYAGSWSDLYSWAMILFGLIRGHPSPDGLPVPASTRYHNDSYQDAAQQLQQSGLPPEWAALIERCLNLEPGQRPKTVAEVRLAIKDHTPSVDWKGAAKEAQQGLAQTKTTMFQVETKVADQEEQLQAVSSRLDEVRTKAKKLGVLSTVLAVLVLAFMAALAVLLLQNR